MQIKRIALGGIIMTVIMFSGCSTTVHNLAIVEEKTLETGKTEQESVTKKNINMNEKESFNAESNINDVIHDSAFDDYGRLIFPVDMEIEDNLKLKDVSSILPWYSEVNTDKTVEIVKERIEGGANEKAVLRLFINCPFVCINFDFFWLNKARQLYMDF